MNPKSILNNIVSNSPLTEGLGDALQTYISPCPNDTFAFDALLNGKLKNTNLTFNYHLKDIEELNQIALLAQADIIKVSFALWPKLKTHYDLLPCGAALGNNVGPLFISAKKEIDITNPNLKIAIPGIHTTANFLLQYAYPNLKNKSAVLFSDIEQKVLDGHFDAGVIIHENRFTYANRGLHKIADLGELWFNKTHLPIPLGGILIKKTLPQSIKNEVANMLKTSIEMAWQRYPSLPLFVTQHAQEMSEPIMRQHIELYVNDYTKNLGVKGMEAIALMEQIIG
jgi:1,4-dihydroxy-6-naphthoate synthase